MSAIKAGGVLLSLHWWLFLL